jgi:hypothetical protein
VFGCYSYMEVANLELGFLVFGHQIFLHLLE